MMVFCFVGNNAPKQQPTVVSPTPGSKNIMLKVTPTTIQTKQGLMQGLIIPAGTKLPPHVSITTHYHIIFITMYEKSS